jgi:hypothetical protein
MSLDRQQREAEKPYVEEQKYRKVEIEGQIKTAYGSSEQLKKEVERARKEYSSAQDKLVRGALVAAGSLLNETLTL